MRRADLVLRYNTLDMALQRLERSARYAWIRTTAWESRFCAYRCARRLLTGPYSFLIRHEALRWP
jgi:hypothetical protein